MWSLLAAGALAQDAAGLPEPVPIAGEPFAVRAVAYALPAPDPAWWTEEQRFVRCRIAVTLPVDGAPSLAVGDCPATMQDAALSAAGQWRFDVPEPPAAVGDAVPVTTFGIGFVARYEETLATITVFAEVDPG